MSAAMQPLVSVKVITYNHEKYIAQCLEGILMQRANFQFEVIIGEDCSTDHTREIVLDYGQRFPETIRVITSETNVGGFQNFLRVQQACRGKYHAMCEGDDYWIDPLKLQKQFDFMEARPQVSMCFHDAFVVRYDKSALPRYYCPPGFPEQLDIRTFIHLNSAFPTASVFARAEVLSSLPEWRKEIRYGDLLARLWCAHCGDLGYLAEAMSVYRVHPGGMLLSNQSLELHFSSINDIYRRFDAETAHQYTDVIEGTLKKINREYHFRQMKKKMGWLGFFLYPDKFIERLRGYVDLYTRTGKMHSR